MATSGSFDTSTAYWTYVTFAWNLVSQNKEENTSTISWNVSLHQSADVSINANPFVLTIDGNEVYRIADKTVAVGQFASGTVVLKHNEDGTRTFKVSMYGSTEIISTIEIYGDREFVLDKIPRASAISYAADVTLGNRCNIQWTPASKEYEFRVYYSLGSWNQWGGVIVKPNQTSLYTYVFDTIPIEVANQIPNSKTGTMTVTLYTYSNAQDALEKQNALGSSSKTFTVTVPSSAGPLAVMNVSAINSLVFYSLDDIYIQGRSKANVSFVGSSAQYGADISSCDFTIDSTKYSMSTASAKDSNYLTSSGTLTVKGVVTDSRGYTASISKNIEVLAYSTPAVVPYSGSSVVCRRENSTQLRIEAARKFSSLGGNNFCSLSFRYAKSGSSMPSSWTEILSGDSSSDKVSLLAAGVTLDEKSSYTVEIKAEDELSEQHILTFSISTDAATFHLKAGGKGAAFGKYAEEDELLDVEWDARFHKGINGVYMKSFVLSTASFTMSMEGGAQNVFLFGNGVYGLIQFTGSGVSWNGTGSVSCSNSGSVVTVNVPAVGAFSALSDGSFEIT